MSDFIYGACIAFVFLMLLIASMYNNWLPRNVLVGKTTLCLSLILAIFIIFALPAAIFKVVGMAGIALVFAFLFYLVVSAPDEDIIRLFKGKVS